MSRIKHAAAVDTQTRYESVSAGRSSMLVSLVMPVMRVTQGAPAGRVDFDIYVDAVGLDNCYGISSCVRQRLYWGRSRIIDGRTIFRRSYPYAGHAMAATKKEDDGEMASQIFKTLKDADIGQISYVPDAGHTDLIKACLADNRIKTTRLTTEEEG